MHLFLYTVFGTFGPAELCHGLGNLNHNRFSGIMHVSSTHLIPCHVLHNLKWLLAEGGVRGSEPLDVAAISPYKGNVHGA